MAGTAGMEWYDRMELNVPFMISVIEKHPEVWDRASEAYKGTYNKRDAWPAIVTEIYPQWPDLPRAGKKQIMDDVKNRWRSITDRLVKSMKTPSGSSPPRKKVPFADLLQFVLTSRNLRRTDGNISPGTSMDTEQNSPEQGLAEEVQDMSSSPGPPNDRPSSAISSTASEPSGCDSCLDTSVSSVVEEASGSTVNATASAASSTPGGGVSRRTWIRAGSGRPVSSTRAGQKKGTTTETSASAIQQLTSRILSLIDNVRYQDELDTFGVNIASRLRSMTRDRQNLIMSAVHVLIMSVDTASIPPPSNDIITGIMNLCNPRSVPPPPPAADASQRFGPAPSFRPEHPDSLVYGRPNPSQTVGQHGNSPMSQVLSQNLYPSYSYDPDYQQF
ncbi:uncharacterized protein [Dendrobates tinctorius]|uniref:uncharacterized protein n=1 Tax=Dendrobates tinctorius TaxID=92724 RepID=UPI003CC93E55